MAFMIKEIIDLKGILLLMLLTIPSQAVTNYDCNGKAFQCVNSTHFMICVDLGRGISTTIDDVIIPCPSPTVCKSTNRFECEFPTPIAQVTEASTIAYTETSSEVITLSPLVTTSIPFEEYFNTLSTTTLSESDLQKSTTGTILTVDQNTVILDITNASKSEIVTTSEDISVKSGTTIDNGPSSSAKPSLQSPTTNSTVIAEPVTVVPVTTNASKSEVVITSEDASIKPETVTVNGPSISMKPSLPSSITDSILTIEPTTVVIDIAHALKSDVMTTDEKASVKLETVTDDHPRSNVKPSLQSSITDSSVTAGPTTVLLDITTTSKFENASVKPGTVTDEGHSSSVKPNLQSSTADSILTTEPTTVAIDIAHALKSEVMITGEDTSEKLETVTDNGSRSNVKPSLQSSITDSIVTAGPTTVLLDITTTSKFENASVKPGIVTDDGHSSSVKTNLQSSTTDYILTTEPTTVVIDIAHALKSKVMITGDDASIKQEIVTDNGHRSNVRPNLQLSATVEPTTVVIDFANALQPEVIITGEDESVKLETVKDNSLRSSVKPSLQSSITDSIVRAEPTTILNITNVSKSEIVFIGENPSFKPEIVSDFRSSVKPSLQSSTDFILTVGPTIAALDNMNALRSEIIITREDKSVKPETVTDDDHTSSAKPNMQTSATDSILIVEPTTVEIDFTNGLKSEVVILGEDASVKLETVTDNDSRSSVKPSLQSSIPDSIVTTEQATVVLDITNTSKSEVVIASDDASIKPETVTDNDPRSSVKPNLQPSAPDSILTVEPTKAVSDVKNDSKLEIVSTGPHLSSDHILSVELSTNSLDITNGSKSEVVITDEYAFVKPGTVTDDGHTNSVKPNLQSSATDSILTVEPSSIHRNNVVNNIINKVKPELSTNIDYLNTLVTETSTLYTDSTKLENPTLIDIANAEMTVEISNNTYYQESFKGDSTLGSVVTTDSTSEVKEIANKLKSDAVIIIGNSVSPSVTGTPVDIQSNYLFSDSVNATVIPTIAKDSNTVTKISTTILSKKLETLTNIHKNATTLIDLTRDNINNNLQDDAEIIGNDLNGLMGNTINQLTHNENVQSSHHEENKTSTLDLISDSSNKIEAWTFSSSDSVQVNKNPTNMPKPPLLQTTTMPVAVDDTKVLAANVNVNLLHTTSSDLDKVAKGGSIVLASSLHLLSVGVDTVDSSTISIRIPIDDNTNTTPKDNDNFTFKYSQTETTNKPSAVTQNQSNADNLSIFKEQAVVKDIIKQPNELITQIQDVHTLPPQKATADSNKKNYTENVDELSLTNAILIDVSTLLPSINTTSVSFIIPEEKKSEISSDGLNNMTERNIVHSEATVNASASETFHGEAVALGTQINIPKDNIVENINTAATTQNLLTVETDTNIEFIIDDTEGNNSEVSITTERNNSIMPQSIIFIQLLDNNAKKIHNFTSQTVIRSITNTTIEEAVSSMIKDVTLRDNMNQSLNAHKNNVLMSHTLLSDTVIEGPSTFGHVLLENSTYTQNSTSTVNNKNIGTTEIIKNSKVSIEPITLFLDNNVVITEKPATSNYQHFNTLENNVFNSLSLVEENQRPVASTTNSAPNTQSLKSQMYKHTGATASSKKITETIHKNTSTTQNNTNIKKEPSNLDRESNHEIQNDLNTQITSNFTGTEGVPVPTSFSISEAPKNVLIANANQKVQPQPTNYNESNLHNISNTLSLMSEDKFAQTTLNKNGITTTDVPHNKLLENKEFNIPGSESNNNINTDLNTQMKSLFKEDDERMITSTINTLAVTEAFKTISVAINGMNNTPKEESLRTSSLKYNENSYLNNDVNTQLLISKYKNSEAITSVSNDISLTESQHGSLQINEASNVQITKFSIEGNNSPVAGKNRNLEVKLVAITSKNDLIEPRVTPPKSTLSSSSIETVIKPSNTDAIEPNGDNLLTKDALDILYPSAEKLLVRPREFKSSNLTETNSFKILTTRSANSSTIPDQVLLARTTTLPTSSDSKQQSIDLQTLDAEKDTSTTIASFVMNHQGPQQKFENISGVLHTGLETESIKKDMTQTAEDSSAFAESINTGIYFGGIAIATSSTGVRLNETWREEEKTDVSRNTSYTESMNLSSVVQTPLTVQKSRTENTATEGIANNLDQASRVTNLFTSAPKHGVTTEIITDTDVLVESNIKTENTHSEFISLVTKPQFKREPKEESENIESKINEMQDPVPAVKERAPFSTKEPLVEILLIISKQNNNNVQKDRIQEEMLTKLENKDVRMDTDTNTKTSTNSVDRKKNEKETLTHELIENTRSTVSINTTHTTNSILTDQNKNTLNAYNITVISNDQGSTPRYTSQTKSTAVGDTQTTEFLTFESTTPKTKLNYFTCNEKKRGRYADELECRKFYICLGNSRIVEGICPVNTVFSEIRKQCTKNLSHCIRHNQFRCVTEGHFSDFLDNNAYYICVKNNVTSFIRFKLQCQKGYHLNKTSVRCNLDKKAEQSSSNSDSSKNSEHSDQSISSAKTEEKETRPEKKFQCKNEGIFADPSNCRRYFVCRKSDKFVYRQRRKKCDSDEIFHADKKTCVDDDSYECK